MSQPYSIRKQFWVDCVYIIALLVWVLIICLFRLYRSPGNFVLLIPIVVFLIGIFNTGSIDDEVENTMFKASYLPMGLILSLALLSWMSRDFTGDKTQFVAVILLAMVFTLFTVIDIWIPRGWLAIHKHARSACQTMAVTLFIFAIATYYYQRPGGPLPG